MLTLPFLNRPRTVLVRGNPALVLAGEERGWTFLSRSVVSHRSGEVTLRNMAGYAAGLRWEDRRDGIYIVEIEGFVSGWDPSATLFAGLASPSGELFGATIGRGGREDTAEVYRVLSTKPGDKAGPSDLGWVGMGYNRHRVELECRGDLWTVRIFAVDVEGKASLIGTYTDELPNGLPLSFEMLMFPSGDMNLVHDIKTSVKIVGFSFQPPPEVEEPPMLEPDPSVDLAELIRLSGNDPVYLPPRQVLCQAGLKIPSGKVVVGQTGTVVKVVGKAFYGIQAWDARIFNLSIDGREAEVDRVLHVWGNATMSNVTVVGGYLCIAVREARQGTISGVTVGGCRGVDAGQGYGLILEASSNMYVEGVRPFDNRLRHLVVAGGDTHYCVFKDLMSPDVMGFAALDLHGRGNEGMVAIDIYGRLNVGNSTWLGKSEVVVVGGKGRVHWAPGGILKLIGGDWWGNHPKEGTSLPPQDPTGAKS